MLTFKKTVALSGRSRRRNALLGGLYAGIWGVLAGTAWGAAPDEALPRLTLAVNGVPIQVEVARTARARERGLAGRTALAADAGMLFVFRRPGRPCFWMKDTLLPLSLAFLNERGMIVQQEELLPGDERAVCARQPVRFALEVARNGPLAHHLQFGRRVVGLPQLPRLPAEPSRFGEAGQAVSAP
ncbi:MAG: DUF192 domain-containing protein [Candidatus Macondimonas sp.]